MEELNERYDIILNILTIWCKKPALAIEVSGMKSRFHPFLLKENGGEYDSGGRKGGRVNFILHSGIDLFFSFFFRRKVTSLFLKRNCEASNCPLLDAFLNLMLVYEVKQGNSFGPSFNLTWLKFGKKV